jgi:crotonobetainyl-CoA:carnitine CoA-transferase CaiB-like acyl-CoA transferase
MTERESLLAAYRVLDLTEGGYLLAGKILGDLGADVIKVEPPGGSPSRNIGPFYRDNSEPGRSLFWFSYNTNKRSITLNIETDEGKALFKRLVKGVDFLFESFEPGYMEGLGLGYEALSRINPRIIMTSMTPFGASGPYAHYNASDLTIMAMGGFLSSSGIPERPPVWISFPQACLHAGNNAAAASMIAHWHRETTGEGQHVDVSTQQCIALSLYGNARAWEFKRTESTRRGRYMRFPNADPGMRLIYPCKDGEVFILLQGGSSVAHHTSSLQLVKYMDENKMASDWLMVFDWVWGFDALTITQDVIDRIIAEVSRFFLTKTKKALFEEALKRRILLAPVADAKDVSENPQLKAREFWVHVDHPELGDGIAYCGPFIKLSEAPLMIKRRPPLIGEHNREIYGELGISKGEVSLLKQAGVI